MSSRGARYVALVVSLLAALAVPALRAPVASASCPTLSYGSRGSCVLAVQKRLKALHYDLGMPDGVYGVQTQHAVIAFQKVNGLYRSGTVNASTRWRLWHNTVIPRLHYIRSGRGLEINVTKQVMYRAYAGRLVRIYDVSTGRPSLPTPLSWSHPFRIWRKALWGGTGYNDSEHYVHYFYPGTLLAIHAYSYVPTYPASHGCVRMIEASAHRLWNVSFVGERLFTYK